MAIIKGQRQYEKWKQGEKLTFKEAILAHCFECNGKEESNTDCQGAKTCALYYYGAHRNRIDEAETGPTQEK